MKALLTRNLGWKLLSLAIAFFVWLSVASEPELATIVSVPVEYRNYPTHLDISSDIAGTIRVEARGPARQLRNLTESRLTAVIDLASVQSAGERTFTLSSSELNLPRGIDLMRTVPAQLRFKFENRVTRLLPVEVPLSGALPGGYSVQQKNIEPAELEVVGPESHVRAAQRLVSDPFDLTVAGENGNTEQILSVYAPDPELRFPGNPRVTVKILVHRLP
jgi:YbbR domain-containing protein